MAARSMATLPEGDDGLYELKLDGSPYTADVTKIGAESAPTIVIGFPIHRAK
jgi:hypothetical protein